MRTTALVLNAMVVVFFAGFLCYTLIAREHLDGLARGFVTEKTIVYSQPVVELADQSLDSAVVTKLLSDEQIAAMRREIAEYRRDAAGYIADLTRRGVRVGPVVNANPLVAKVAAVKERIRTFYDETLDALIDDLRIFATSNLIAGAVAFVLAFRSGADIRKSTVGFSWLMFAAVLYCAFMYVDDLTFFRILFRMHLGWWYAVGLGAVMVGLWLDWGHAKVVGEYQRSSNPDRN
jgi:hypothetical protein